MKVTQKLWRGLFVLALGGMALGSCKKEPIRGHGLDSTQLIAGRLDGTWGDPMAMVTPNDIPKAVFGNMRLVFTTDEDGYPAQFVAKDCPIVFSPLAGNWSVSGTDAGATVKLTEVGPVDEFDLTVTSAQLTLSFYMGWENTDTGETGEGEFRLTLNRK